MWTLSCWTARSPSVTGRATDGPTTHTSTAGDRVNVQVDTDPAVELLWLSPALPGRTHDLTAARTHQIIRICERQGVPVLADLAYQDGGLWVTTGIKRRPLQELTLTEETLNRALAAARAPVERGVARLKSWRIFRRSRCSPYRMMSIAKAVLTGVP